jgi:putative PIN family toxin of toxin-antitoxin system
MPMSPRRDTAPRAVIDTNVLLDWLVFRAPEALALGRAIEERRWTWCATPAMLDELRSVLDRPLAERWEAARKLALTSGFERWPMLWPAAGGPMPADIPTCRDPTDQMFIELALACRPCWLVTRDRALLALRRRAAVRDVVIAVPQIWSHDSGLAAVEPAWP